MVAITDINASITSQQRYLPFGQVRTDVSSPNPQSNYTDFAFTGQRAVSGLSLMDYHARMYDNLIGRFIQPDVIIPSESSPQSFNRFSYVLNSPINATDPTGHKYCSQGTSTGSDCLNDYDLTAPLLASYYGVKLSGHFSDKQVDGVYSGVSTLANAMGVGGFRKTFGGVTFSLGGGCDPNGMCTTDKNDVGIGQSVHDPNYIEYNTVHELGHVWDQRCNGCMSLGMAMADSSIHTAYIDPTGFCPVCMFRVPILTAYDVNGKTPTTYARTNRYEDWAESLASYINPSLVGKAEPGEQPYQMDSIRRDFVEESLASVYQP